MAAGLLLSVVGAACGSGDDDAAGVTSRSTPSVVAGGSTTTTAPGDPSVSTTVVDGGPTTTAPDGGPASTVAPVATTAPPATAAPGPVALTPAAPGLYRYSTSGAATFGGTSVPFPGVTTNQVDPPSGTRQHATRNLQDGSGNGSRIEYTFDYRPDGMYLVSIRFTTSFSTSPVGPVNDVRDLTPPTPLLFLATGSGPGASRTLDIPTGTGGSARVVVEVLGIERLTIGRQLDTLVVRSVATLPPGQITGTQSITVNLDPSTRLWVKERGVGDATAGGLFTLHTEYQALIQSLTPG